METLFGHYRVESCLGWGGAGEVWRAHDTRLDRLVALKTMRPDLLAHPDAAERFRRAVWPALRLEHPNILPVHDVGEIDGRLYVDMQLVDGDSVADLLDLAGPLAPTRVAAIVESVSAALDRAHGRDGRPGVRMLHRDVKPGNILVERRPRLHGHVHLADFGLARAVDSGADPTAPGVLIGTPAYLAPELWRGDDPDHRTDVYALAATTFEMLVGRRPFTGRDGPALVDEHLHRAVPRATALLPDLPGGVDDVLARAMAKSPDDRHPSAGEFAESLREALAPAATDDPRLSHAGTGPAAVHFPAPVSGDALFTPARRVSAVPAIPPGEHHEPAAAPWDTAPGPADTRRAAGPAPTRQATAAYLGSRRHFTGLALALLSLPLHLFGFVPAGWLLVVSGVLLYALGVVADLAVRSGRR